MEDPSEYSLALAPFRSLHLDYCYRKTSQNQNKKHTTQYLFFFFFVLFLKKIRIMGCQKLFATFIQKYFIMLFLKNKN